jgi:hypothetical protein
MHVHMSFRSVFLYSQLTRVEFPSTIVAEVRKWAQTREFPRGHPIWKRLSDNCDYCRHVYDAEAQLVRSAKHYNHDEPGNRYTVINYAFARLRTIECRLLPMMATVEEAIDAIHKVLDVTEKFLVATARRGPKLIEDIAITEENLVQELVIRV